MSRICDISLVRVRTKLIRLLKTRLLLQDSRGCNNSWADYSAEAVPFCGGEYVVAPPFMVLITPGGVQGQRLVPGLTEIVSPWWEIG